MNTKYEHFGEMFVSLEECHIISDLLRKQLLDRNLGICIDDTIDSEYFETMDGIIVINHKKGIDLDGIKNRYM